MVERAVPSIYECRLKGGEFRLKELCRERLQEEQVRDGGQRICRARLVCG